MVSCARSAPRGLASGPVDEFLRFLDDARADERASSRSKERWLRLAAEEGATLAGTLVDLAERGTAVSIRTTAGHVHHGTVRLVGADFVILAGSAGDVWLALAAVAVVRPGSGVRQGPASSDRPAVDLFLAEALGRIAGERCRLAVVSVGGELVAGELRSVGVDVATLGVDGDPGGVCYVSLASIATVLRSG